MAGDFTKSGEPTIAIIGATGGCVLAFLVRALSEGYTCSALLRTPNTLTSHLQAHKILPSIIDTHLTIRTGDSKDPSAVASALTINGRLVDIILSGIGGRISNQSSYLKIRLEDPHVCEESMVVLLSALKSVLTSQHGTGNGRKPLLVAISSTGLSEVARDIPLLMVPLYHWMLVEPREDKSAMEKVILEEGVKVERERVIGDWVVVRSSFMTNAPGVGASELRIGIERDGRVEKSEVGYTISRQDVGSWIFQNLVEDKMGTKDTYRGAFVSLIT